MNIKSQAIAHEAAVAAEHLAVGVTALGKANYSQIAYYGQAFFALSTGFERTAKLVLLVDHVLSTGEFPPRKTILEYKHDIKRLLDQADHIAEKQGLTKEERLPNSSIHHAIIEILSMFANNVTRYYNIDIITSTMLKEDIHDPVKAWYEQVTIPILDKYYKPHHRFKDEEAARYADVLEPVISLHFYSEQGILLNSVYDTTIHAKKTDFATPFSRMYIMQIARFLANLIYKFTFLNYGIHLEDLPPSLSDYFRIFCSSDNQFKKRKTWSIYSL